MSVPSTVTNPRRRGTVPRAAVVAVLMLVTGACAREESRTDASASGAEECAAPEVRGVVEDFGRRLAQVSLQADDSLVVRQVREAYSTVVTPELLSAWTADPDRAPGREVSSPWPARIDVRGAEAADAGGCRVEGDIVLVTSVEQAQGGEAGREPVRLRVVREDDAWRIAEFAQTGG